MAYLKTEWLEYDEHAKNVNMASWYALNVQTIDRKIVKHCIDVGIAIDEIPVDGNGYLDNEFLQDLGVNCCLYYGYSAKWGIRDSADDDVYKQKAYLYNGEYTSCVETLSRYRVL